MKYTKSEFYKIWYVRFDHQSLNAEGYPSHLSWGDGYITTKAQWDGFVDNEPEIEDFVRWDEDAANLQEVPFVRPYDRAREYPNEGDQLDGIYKALLAVKASGINLGSAADAYLDSITAVKTEFPKN